MIPTSVSVADGDHTGSIFEWKSHRLRRVCRSTLSAETARGHAEFVTLTISEMLFHDFTATSVAHPRLQLVPITDCKPLFDSVRTLTGPYEDKRTQIDIISIRQSSASDIKWVPTTLQRADALTKRDPQLRNEFRYFMGIPVVVLQEA